MKFVISNTADPAHMFLASLSELQQRFDPEFILFRRTTHKFKHPLQKLKALFQEPPQYGAGERGLERTSPEQPRYVRITDIDEHGMLTEEMGATAETVEARYLLQDNDLLIARSGNTVGKAYLHKQSRFPYSCFYAGYLIRFRFDADRILPDYVFALTQLPYYKAWVNAVQRAAGQPNINAQEYSCLELPIPPLPIQERIIGLIQDAYGAKQRRDAEAKALLRNIDDLLLTELGIAPQPEPPNTIERRIFRRAFSEVTGGRLDPVANQEKRKRLESAIRKSTFEVQPLRDLVTIGKDIVTGIAGGQRYIGLENICGDTGCFVETVEKESVSTAAVFKTGQVLFPKLRPYLNKTYVADGGGLCSTEFHVFTPVGVDGRYLTAFLRSKAVVEITSLLMTGNTLPRLQMSDIEQLQIPVPPQHVQQQIAGKTEKIKQAALALRGQAAADLAQAKHEIEALILGKEE